MLTIRSPRYLGTIQDNNRHQQKPTDTKRRSQAPQKVGQGCVAAHVDIEWHLLVPVGVFWCLTASFSVLWFLEMRGGCLRSFSKDIWVLFMDVVKVWVPLREYLSVQALYDAAIALHWKISERQNSTHSWNIKIRKPPYVSSLKIIGLLNFLNFWVHQKKITIYSLFGSPCIVISI